MSWLYSLVFAGLMFSSDAGPVSTVPTVIVPSGAQTAQQNETERIEKTFPLTANGRVSVSNVNGPITIKAWDQNQVSLVAIKTADSKEHLADVDIKIDARPDYIEIETDYSEWKTRSDDGRWRNNNNGNVTVDYQLSVPRGAVLNEIENVNGDVVVSDFTNVTKVSAVNGTVRATNLRGAADLSTVNGEVAADFERLEKGSKISLSTVNGHVNLIIPSDSSATVSAESLNGEISNDFTLPVRKGKYVGRDLHGRLGSGDVAIKLESVNGALSFKHRNDGRPLSPATNLLPPKGSDDEDWDGDNETDNNDRSVVDVAKMNRDIARATANAQRQATRDVEREMSRITPDVSALTTEITKDAVKSVNSAVTDTQIKDSMQRQREAMRSMREALFIPGVPRVETKSDAIPVKGTPTITIDAVSCSVRIRGWDKPQIQYSLMQLESSRQSTPLQISENHTDSIFNIKVVNSGHAGAFGDSTNESIDIFVPRKSNIKVTSTGEIRIEGVSGELQLSGDDEAINVRDSQGKLTVKNSDGRVRVIGFEGDVNAVTSGGDIYLEGTFTKLSARSDGGNFTVTLPANSNADLTADADIQGDGFDLTKRGDNLWRIGAGGPKFDFHVEDGSITVRNSSVLGRD